MSTIHASTSIGVTDRSRTSAHRGPTCCRQWDPSRARVATSISLSLDHATYHSPTVIRPSRGSAHSPLRIAASASVAHLATTRRRGSDLVERLPSAMRTVACHLPDGSRLIYAIRTSSHGRGRALTSVQQLHARCAPTFAVASAEACGERLVFTCASVEQRCYKSSLSCANVKRSSSPARMLRQNASCC